MNSRRKRKKYFFRPWRTIVPALFSLILAVLVLRLSYPLPGGSGLLLWLSRLDPVLFISQLGRSPALPSWAWLPLLLLLATLMLGRVFCGWLCPVGGLLAVLQDWRDWLAGRRILDRRPPGPARGRAARPVNEGVPGNARYYWLSFLLALLLAGAGWPLLLTPYFLLGHEVTRLWSLQFPWLLLAVVLLGILVFPRFWCVYLCPTGLFWSAVGSFRHWRFTAGPGCDHCGRCRSACPVQAATPGGAAGGQCILCGRCLETCPRGAVRWTARRGDRKSAGKDDPPIMSRSRRHFLQGAAAVLGALGIWLFLGRQAYARPLRPPGAAPEPEFLARCARCGRCIKVCPNQSLRPLSLASGSLAAADTPHLALRQGRCEMCLLCQEVCPTGAIGRVPVEQVKIGTAEIDRPRCLAWGQGKHCLICVEQCPFQAAVMDEMERPVIVADRCKGCGACENACPVQETAVRVYP
jgi:ferredoxin-type protein NapF